MSSIQDISDEVAADIISEMQVIERRDLGAATIYHGMHRHRGRVAVIANSSGPSFVIRQAAWQLRRPA